jgi:hypothetical protein
MLGVLVTPPFGVPLAAVGQDLDRVMNELQNARAASDNPYAYLQWVSESARKLRGVISSADVERLLFTRRYELILAGMAGAGDPAGLRVLDDLISLEFEDRWEEFYKARRDLDRVTKSWSRPGAFVVADTSVYIEHEDKLEVLDFAALAGAPEEPVHLLLPIVVVDELDGLKNRGADGRTKWRAGYTLAVLDRIFTDGKGPATLRAADSAMRSDGITRGAVTAEIVFDPPRHVRLPINDDEIIDRILAVEPLADRMVTFLTFDTSQSARARAAGLVVKKLTRPIGEEPKPRT